MPESEIDGQDGSTSEASTEPNPGTIPKRDYFLLPLLSLLTVLVMFGAAEILTRVIWAQQEHNYCGVPDAVGGGAHIMPNCTTRMKNAEGPWATYRYNDCGYRSETSCGPKPPGAIRIVTIGSSVSMGIDVPYEQAYFAQAASELSRVCHRPVDVQNLGGPGVSPLFTYHKVDEALRLKPDVLLFPFSPTDIEGQIDPMELAERNDPTHVTPRGAVQITLSPMRRLQTMLVDSRTVVVAQHFLLQNKDLYLRLYMNYGDKADFLRQPLTPAWQQRFADMNVIISDISRKSRAAGVPLIVIPVPSRAEAAWLSSPQLPPHVDPFAFGRQVEQMVSDDGADYVDMMKPFSRIPNAEKLFFVVDGHLTADGQGVIAQNLVHKLLDGSIPAFLSCDREN